VKTAAIWAGPAVAAAAIIAIVVMTTRGVIGLTAAVTMIASAVTAGATLALAFFTRKYILHTESLVNQNADQGNLLRQQATSIAELATETGRLVKHSADQGDLLRRQAASVAELAAETGRLARHSADQTELLKRQADQVDEIQHVRVRQAVRAILVELRVNDYIARLGGRGPFLVSAYAAGLAALQEARCNKTSLTTLASAHAMALRFSALYMVNAEARTGQESGDWGRAGRSIAAAYKATCADGDLMAYIDWPEYQTPIPSGA